MKERIIMNWLDEAYEIANRDPERFRENYKQLVKDAGYELKPVQGSEHLCIVGVERIDPFNYVMIRPNIFASIALYIEQGRPVGDFLQAVICDKLTESVCRADENNLRAIKQIAQLFYHCAPMPARGSLKAYTDWLKLGGMYGTRLLSENDE